MINSYSLKLQGKAELPEAIEIGANYHVSLSGSIVSQTESDNDDGSHSIVYSFRPVQVELLDPKGKTLKLKDPRKNSSKIRAYLWKVAQDEAPLEDFDAVYDAFTLEVMALTPMILREAVKRLKQ